MYIYINIYIYINPANPKEVKQLIFSLGKDFFNPPVEFQAIKNNMGV